MTDLTVLAAATLAAGFLRGVTGFGFALAAVPFYSLSVPPLQAVILAQMLQIAAAPTDVVANWRHLDRRALGLLCAGAIVCTPLGAYFATRLDADVMRLAIAVVVLLGLFALLAKLRIPEGRIPAIAAGGIAGLLGGLAAMPGPPAVAYFLGRGADKATSRASLLLFFAFTASIALASLALGADVLSWAMLWQAAAMYPLMLAGTWAGTLLFRRLGDGHYRSAALGVLFLSAILTGVKGLGGLL
ncbi:sulfite exporter TauE/SafE family protein [Sagittula sp. SSi028]|uniref:sulfite exporter TauE/SafE family protein n=1 Tax=Sagittula sp. SSi028 TaxID=3400636 RepID=UPI003AF4AB5E